MLDLVAEGAIYTEHEAPERTLSVPWEILPVILFPSHTQPVTSRRSHWSTKRLRRQGFGDPHVFHMEIRLWLAWCNCVSGIKPN
jgi:hypothetical protein